MTEQVLSETLTITPLARHVPERSNPGQGMWFFVYHIQIFNRGRQAVRLVNRHWIITNAEGKVSEVYGAGVVGEQPRIEPGEAFAYTSACPLDTAFGTMQGHYEMVADDGTTFDAPIPAFSLALPHAVN